MTATLPPELDESGLPGDGGHDASRPTGMLRGIFAPFANLLGGQIVSAVLGLLFWVAAARFAGAHDVGVAAAAMSTQTLLGLLVSLGLGTHLVTTLPLTDLEDRRRLILRSLAVVSVVGAVGGVIAVGLGPILGGSLGTGLSDPGVAPVFVIGVVAAGWVVVFDEGMLGLGNSRIQLRRNLTASVTRFVLAGAFLSIGLDDAVSLDVCWVLPLVLTVPLGVRRLGLPAGRRFVSLREDVVAHIPSALRHYLLNLALAAATQAVPVVAGIVLLTAANATFTVAWLLATSAFLPPFLITVALFAHGANDDAVGFRRHMRTTLPAALGLSAIIVVGTYVVGGPVLHIFGGRYADASETLLRLLVLAGFGMVVKDHLVTYWRSQRRYVLATGFAMVAFLVEVAGCAVGGHLDGAHGLVLGWLGALAVEVAIGAPLLVGALFSAGSPAETAESLEATVPAAPAPTADPAPSGPGRPDRLAPAGAPRRVGPHRIAPWRVATGVVVALGAIAVAGLSVHQSMQTTGTPSDPTGGIIVPSPTTFDAAVCRPTAKQPGPAVDVPIAGGSTAQVRYEVDQAAASGATVVSTTVSWAQVRPSGRAGYRWAPLDRIAAAARARGLRLKISLEQTPSWAIVDQTTAGPWTPPLRTVELHRWSVFVGDTMKHLAGIGSTPAFVEAWPLPDRRTTWATGPDAHAYAALLQATYDAVRSTNSRTKVITGSLTGADFGFLNGLARALGGSSEQPYDLIGVHPLAGPPKSPKGFLGYRLVHTALGHHGAGTTPLYLTGYGSPGGADAGSIVRALGLTTCTPYVRVLSPGLAGESGKDATAIHAALTRWTTGR